LTGANGRTILGRMKIALTSVMVDDQAKALEFYTKVLGFVVKHDVPMGEYRWLTVVSPIADHQALVEERDQSVENAW